tara:strand:+ start:38 stop:1570 length:1533 start_codon:yes stop_codon:yes gene_type:complete
MKKKRFNTFFNILFLFFLSFFYSQNLFAKDNCEKFFDDLRNNFDLYTPNDYPRYIYNDFGFDFKFQWDDLNKKWILAKDDDGYLIIGRISDEENIGKINIGDILISANGKDIRKFNLKPREIFLEEFFEDGEEVEFILKNKDEFKVKLKKKEKSLVEPYLDFYIDSIELNEKNNKTEARIVINAQQELDKEFGITKAALKNFYIPDETEPYYVECPFNAGEWKKKGYVFPFNAKFNNLHKIDYNTFSEEIMVKVYDPENIPIHKKLGWDDKYSTVDYDSAGLYTFNNSFNLQNFPFDKQTLKFHIVNNAYMMFEIAAVSDASQLNLQNFIENKSINGWNILSGNLKYEPYKDPYFDNYQDSLIAEIVIERKYSYYIYKVIIPIVLILMICWSSLWIPAREIESKLTITIVCLLSLIAYNFVIDKDLPKLEYLTTLDWIILISYFYATVPNFFAIISFNLKKNNQLGPKIDNLGKKYGAVSYLVIIFMIIVINVNINPENSSTIISWMSAG